MTVMMSEQSRSSAGKSGDRPAASSSSSSTVVETASPLETSQGTTTIADQVVSKIAGIAVQDVSGVHALGGGAARAMGSLRERIPGSKVNHSQGITVEVGERQAAVDVVLIAEYGVAIADLAAGVRRNVISSVEQMTGLQVTEVNIEVVDVFIPGQDDDEDSDADQRSVRVQ